MTINSISSNNLAATALDIRPAAQQSQVKSPEAEKKIEAEKEIKSNAVKPSVNASGQAIGTTISTKA